MIMPVTDKPRVEVLRPQDTETGLVHQGEPRPWKGTLDHIVIFVRKIEDDEGQEHEIQEILGYGIISDEKQQLMYAQDHQFGVIVDQPSNN